MGELTLILGGARSGKSTFAEKLATEQGGAVVYIATAEAKDDEMAARIKKHRTKRPLSWQTREIPINISGNLADNPISAEVVLLDCVTLLVTNLLMAMNPDLDDLDEVGSETAVSAEISALITTIQQSSAHWLVVSNEVGLGLVPPYPLGPHLPRHPGPRQPAACPSCGSRLLFGGGFADGGEGLMGKRPFVSK